MSSALDLITIDSPQPDVLATFWCAALALHETQREDEPYGSIANLADPDGNQFDLCAYRP